LTDHTLSVLFKGCDNYYRKLNYRKLKQTQTLTGFIRFSIRDLVFRVRVWIGLVVGSLVFVNYHSPCLMVILVTQHKKLYDEKTNADIDGIVAQELMLCTSDKLALCLRLNWHSVNTSLASSQSVCSLTSSQPSTSLHSLTALVSFPHDTYSITINCCTVLRPGYGNAVRFSPFIAVVSRLSRFPTQQQCNNSTSKPVVTGVKERRIKVQMTVQNVAIFTWHYFFL